MNAVPLVLVVGGDGLAIRVCEELLATHGHRAAVVWMHDRELAAKLAALGDQCRYVAGAPDDDAALRDAGVPDADAIMVLSDDDRLNLQVALKARDMNPAIRIVMRQFNRTLGVKLEENLSNCSVLSLASHSAAAFAAAALDPGCFGALRFPDPGGVLTAFATRTAAELGIAGLAAGAAQHRLCARVVALNGSRAVPPSHAFARDDQVTVFACVERLEAAHEAGQAQRAERRDRPAEPHTGVMERLRRVWVAYPVLIRVAAGAAAIFIAAVTYFAFALQLDPVTAFYFVATTFTSTGYGDVTPLQSAGGRLASPNRVALIAASLLMFAGVASIGIFIAFATSALTRAQFTAIQGLRQIRTRGHVLVFGCGNVGTRVVEYLRALDRHVVVVELKPDPVLVEMSNRGGIELVTGDATRDATLDLCNIPHAHAVIAATDSDTANLEIALGVLARSKHASVVMRVQDQAFADSIARHFKGIRTYSTAALAAPVFAMIARFPKTRGRIALGDDAYSLAERVEGQEPQPPSAQDCIPLGVWRNGAFRHVDAFDETEPFDRVLFLVPLSQFKSELSQNGEAVAVRTT
ncbi:MAG TPA: NAD-binding protein [Xanthomonadales bacterium]|nr:NAD-binding protein [Xanthomonadales bacterium]